MARSAPVTTTRRLLALAAAATLFGIALSATGAPAVSFLTVAGLSAMVIGLHRFGRSGADRGR